MALKDWAVEVLEPVREIAAILDADEEGYVSAANAQLAAVMHPELTPSGQILEHMREAGASFLEITLESARAHSQYFATLPLTPEKQDMLSRLAADSLQEQRHLEEHSDQPFDQYLEEYFRRV